MAYPGFEKKGAQGARGLAPKIFLANLGDFLKNLAQKGVGVRRLRSPSGSAPCTYNCIFSHHVVNIVKTRVEGHARSEMVENSETSHWW